MALNKPTGDMLNAGSNATPAALGTATAGTSTSYSRGDHAHAMPTASQVGALGATEAVGGDLTGNMPSPTVNKLQGQTLALQGTPGTGQVLTWTGSAWAPATPSTGTGGGGANGLTYYFREDVAADSPTTNLPGTPKQLGRTGSATATSITTGTLTTGAWTLFGGYVSEATPIDPDVTAIPAGLWDFNVWAYGDANANAGTVIRAKVYIYNGTDAPTLLGTSGEQVINNVSAQFSLSVLVPQTTVSLTDRIYVAVEVKASANGHTATLQFGDGQPSHVHTSLPLVGGTGLWKTVAGTLQSPASLLVNADVDASAAIDWSKMAGGYFGARVKVVGRDASTIQGCLNLITDATASNPAQVLIPAGLYTENLTLKGSVSLSAIGTNNGLNSVVQITGNHTFTGGSTAANNSLQLSGIRFNGSNAASPTFTFSATGAVGVSVNFETCTIGNDLTSTSAVGMLVNSDVIVKLNDVKSLMYSVVGQGGTHFDLNGGSLYATNLSTEFGTCAFLLRGTNGSLKPYVELKSCDIRANGANVVNITSTTALMTAGWCSFSSSATTVNAFNIAGAGSLVGVFNSSFSMPAGASNYLVTGVAGSFFFSSGNSLSNTAVTPYETKVDALVSQYTYATGPLAFADGTSISSGYFTGSKTHDFPSLAANSTSATTVTCTGATTSMFADACLSTNTAGVTLVANVTGANTVTVRAINNTGATVDLASGTLKVRASL